MATTITSDFKDVIERTAELGGKKGPCHPWWALARALKAVTEEDEAVFNRALEVYEMEVSK